jgi:inner membrane protein
LFIGHLPAGYISTKIYYRYSLNKISNQINYKCLLFFGLLGSVFPDFDIFYFYLIDKKQHLHHGYWIHLPIFWIILTCIGLISASLLKKDLLKACLSIFFINVFIHLFLDTIVGKVRWLYPLSTKDYFMFDVPAIYNWWVWNFILHWTFLFEIVLVILAVIIAIKSNRRCIFSREK